MTKELSPNSPMKVIQLRKTAHPNLFTVVVRGGSVTWSASELLSKRNRLFSLTDRQKARLVAAAL